MLETAEFADKKKLSKNQAFFVLFQKPTPKHTEKKQQYTDWQDKATNLFSDRYD